jgi:hypothetical protein
VQRDCNSIVDNSTDREERFKKHPNEKKQTESDYNTMKHSSLKIKISDATLEDSQTLGEIQNLQYMTIEKLKISLHKSECRADKYEAKFHKIKTKIYQRCKRLNEEVANVRKSFSDKMQEFFMNYTKMLKEIIITNSNVHFFFN